MRRSFILSGFALSLLLLGGIFPLSCGTNNSPTSPPAATPTPAPTPAMNWINAYWTKDTANALNNSIIFDLQVNGQPATTVGVTVTGGGVTLPIPFVSSPVTNFGLANSYYGLGPVTYTAGVSYVFSTTYHGQSWAATLVAPGDYAPVTDTTSLYNGAITYLSWGGIPTPGSGYVQLQETGPVSGPANVFYFANGTTAVALPPGTPATVIGYSASAPSTYTLRAVLQNQAPGPPGSYNNAIMENLINHPVTLN